MSALIESSGPIRAMTAADVEAVIAIELAAYPFPWTEGIFHDCIRVGYHCHVYERDKAVQGYAIWSVAVGESHLLNLCVDPRLQGRGIGSALLDYVAVEAAGRGAEALFLEVRPSNVPAIALYERCGFNQIHVRRDYYPAPVGREDAVVMARYLFVGDC